MIIGGVAASLLGRPRTTRDVDAVVWIEDPKDWARFLTVAQAQGLTPRIDDPIAFAQRARVLLLRHEPSAIDIDVALGALPFEEEAIERASEGKLGTIQVPLPTPEDLVIMKAIAHRPRDVGDIEAVLSAHPKLDRSRIRRYVAEFAELLERPELLTDLEALMKKAPKPATRKRRRP